MSKIFFKVNNKKADDVEKENAEIPVTENTAVATEPAPEQKKSDEPVQIALFPEDEQRDAAADDTSANMGKEPFDKEKIVKYFKRHPKKTINSKVGRFSPKLNKGLTQSQVETRFRQFLFNDTDYKEYLYLLQLAVPYCLYRTGACKHAGVFELSGNYNYHGEHRHRNYSGNPFKARHRQTFNSCE